MSGRSLTTQALTGDDETERTRLAELLPDLPALPGRSTACLYPRLSTTQLPSP